MIQIKMTPEYLAKNFTYTFKPAFNQEQIEKWLIEQVEIVCLEKDKQIKTLTEAKEEFWAQYQDIGKTLSQVSNKLLEAGFGNPDTTLIELIDEVLKLKQSTPAPAPLYEPGWPDVYCEIRRLRGAQENMLREIRVLKGASNV